MKKLFRKVDMDMMLDALFYTLFDIGLLLAILGLCLTAWDLFWLGVAISAAVLVFTAGIIAIAVGASLVGDSDLLCGLAGGLFVMFIAMISMAGVAVASPIMLLVDKITELPFGRKIVA